MLIHVCMYITEISSYTLYVCKVKQLETDNWLLNIFYQLLEIWKQPINKLCSYSLKVHSTIVHPQTQHAYVCTNLCTLFIKIPDTS